MSRHRRLVLPLLAALALAALVVGVSACGYSSDSKDVVEGEPVKLGELQYNVIFSRYLNPNDNEDSAYLVGQPPPPEGSTYFGVFFEVQNESDEPQTLPSTLTITDADHQTFDVIPSESLYALPVRRRSRIPGTDPGARLDPPAGPDRGLAGALPAARRGLRQPAADARRSPAPTAKTAEVTLDL